MMMERGARYSTSTSTTEYAWHKHTMHLCIYNIYIIYIM